MNRNDRRNLTADEIPFGESSTPPLTEEELRLLHEHDPGETSAMPPTVLTAEAFAAEEEQGAEALVGDVDDALVPENGDVMLYGDGGAGKTTLAIDLACHLAAGDDWLQLPIRRAVRVLLIENEGPRPLFRVKLRRKLVGWQGSAIGDRLLVLEEPWARFTFATPDQRKTLAQVIAEREVDVVIVGPLARSGMNEAGTLQEVRDFMELVADARARSKRRVAVVLIHHENKGGKVSGAWEGSGDTLLHVQGQGHGRTRLYVQKARWSSSYHGTSLHLVWQGGDSFARDEDAAINRPERVWTDIAAFVLDHGGCGWVSVERAVSGQGDYLRRRRDAMLADGELINAERATASLSGTATTPRGPSTPSCPRRDTTRTTSRQPRGTREATVNVSPCPPLKGTRGTGTRFPRPPTTRIEMHESQRRPSRPASRNRSARERL